MKTKIMTLIAHCLKKKSDWIYCCKGCVIHIRIVQEEGNKSAQDLYTQNNKAFINAFHAWVQNSHATKVCRDFVGQLVLYEFLIALWQFLFCTQCTNYCWTQTTWHNICIPHTTFTPLKLYFGKNKKIKETRKYIRLYNQFHWCS